MAPDATGLGQTALSGWRAKVADGVAQPLSTRTPLSDDQVRALVGIAFFALSVYYVAGTISKMVQEARGS